MNAIKPAHFPWFRYEDYTFSLGLQHEDKVWLSGHSASEFDPETKHIVVRGGMTDQATTAYAKISAILDAAGLGFGDVHRVVEYVTQAGIDHYAEAAAIREQTFGAHTPAVCTVVVDRLLRPAAFIEIEVTAGPAGHPVHGGYEADGVVYLSTITAQNLDGTLEAEDLVGQTRVCFERMTQMLEKAGVPASQVVKTVDYSTRATIKDYKHTGTIRREFLPGPVYPGAAGILLSRLHAPGVLVSLDVIASRHPLEVVNPGWERYGKLTYSPAVKAGTLLFMSGQAALDPATEQAMFAGDVVAQAEYTYENIIRVLETAGLGPEHLLKTIEYVTPDGLERYRDVAKVRERLLRSPYPASTGAICDALLRPEFLIEVDPLAYIP